MSNKQIQTDYNQADNTKPDFLFNKPTLGSMASQSTGSFEPTIVPSTSGKVWNGLKQWVSAAPVAFSGVYTDLTGLPTIPAAQVQTDWNASTGIGVVLNKPTLFSGAFSALTSKPTSLAGYGIVDAYPLSGNPSGFLLSASLSPYLTTSIATSTYYPSTNPSGYISSVPPQTWTSITGKPTFATVATTGAYLDLSGLPTLGTAASQSSASFATSAQGTLASTALQSITGAMVIAALGYTPAAPLYTSYQASVTQTGTSAPTGTQLTNGFTGTTFAWARTGVGTYTVTASSPVFTANKTKCFFGPLNNALGYINYSVTSTTVITITTSVTSILSLVLTTGAADGLMTLLPVDIRVYP